jgi:hypothetical protein
MFDVNFILRTKTNSITQQDIKPIPLEQCTINHWNVSDEFIKTYNRMNFSKMLCPQIGQRIPL